MHITGDEQIRNGVELSTFTAVLKYYSYSISTSSTSTSTSSHVRGKQSPAVLRQETVFLPLLRAAEQSVYVCVCAHVCACTGARGVLNHGVDLDHGGVILDKQVVEFDHVLGCLVDQRHREAHLLSNLHVRTHINTQSVWVRYRSIKKKTRLVLKPCGTCETSIF